MMSRVGSVLAGLSLSASLTQAQAVVAGQVIDQATRAPLTRVSIELLGPRDTVLATTTSAGDGTFTLEAPGAGVFRVRLSVRDAVAHVSDSLVVANGEYLARAFPITLVARAYLSSEVHRPVSPAPGYRGPRYPVELRQDHISGCVLAEFIVDERGHADTMSLKVLKVSHLAFAQAVRAALPDMRFIPAQIDGRNVRQRVVQPFDFTITAETRRIEVGPAVAPVVGIGGSSAAASGRRAPQMPTTPPPSPPPPKPAMCGSSSR